MTTLPKINIQHIFEKAVQNAKLEINREMLLQEIANKIANTIRKTGLVNINFICTHNSRRSQFSQAWAYYAMEYYGISNGNSYSSGTAVTAFYKNTVKALENSGFKFSIDEFKHNNPKYIINYNNSNKQILGYSKLVEDVTNKTPFIAITTCGNADENCPVILDASARFHLPYKDPKWSDGQENEDEIYLKTSILIAGEMGFLFKEVKNLI